MLAVMLAALGLVAGCGGGSGSPSARASSGPDAKTQITQNWEKFFDAKTDTDTRVGLLQDGEQFRDALAAQGKSTFASSASAKVKTVDVTGPKRASVGYDILLGGQPALTDQHGTAVKESGTWKVSAMSFCGLLKLIPGGGPPPPVCGSASQSPSSG